MHPLSGHPWRDRPTAAARYHPAMEASTHGRIRIEAFEVARFSHPAESPLAGRTGIVMAYAVVHPAGLLLFDTGIGTGNADIDEAYHPVVQDLRSLLRWPRPRAGRCRRARVLAPPLRPRRPERRLPGSPDPRPGGRARGGHGSRLHDRRVGRLPRRALRRGGRRGGAAARASGSSRRPATPPATSRWSSTAWTDGRCSSGRPCYTRAEWDGASGPGVSGLESAWDPAAYRHPSRGSERSSRTSFCSVTTGRW